MVRRSGHLPLEFRGADLGRHRRHEVLVSLGVPAGMVTAIRKVGAKAARTTALVRAILAHPSLVIVEPEAIDTDIRFAESCCRILREYAAETGAGIFWATYSTRLACTADRAWTYSLGGAVDLDS